MSKLNEMIDTSLGNIKNIIDVNTVVGAPVETTGGTVIIPVSKVSLGYVSGGVDYLGKNTPIEKGQGFGGGGGTGITLTPVGFLVTKADGDVTYLPVIPGESAVPANDKVDTVISLIEKSPEIFGKIKALIKKKDKSEKSNDEADKEGQEGSDNKEDSNS